MIQDQVRALALRQLPAMFRPESGLFVFRLRDVGGMLVPEGLSARYTSITLIGLAGENPFVVAHALHGQRPADVCRQMVEAVGGLQNVGDVALLCWAALASSCDAPEAWARLVALAPDTRPCAVVELSWALSALSLTPDRLLVALRNRTADRLKALYNPVAHGFPHTTSTSRGARGHVSCFADQVYPILALSQYAEATGDKAAARIATSAADHICRLQGNDGQWWWHYDARSGAIVERYPVYSVHQHAMAPMALSALERVTDRQFAEPIARGLAWLACAPELGGGSLIAPERHTIWRKVARREPGKTSRYLQALATRIGPGISVPGLDTVFPAGAIDFECRPYEFGWFLFTCQGTVARVPDTVAVTS